MPQLLTVTCTKPGFRRYGRAWDISTLVEVSEDSRELSKGSPASCAITRKDLTDLRWLITTPNCPLGLQDASKAQAELGGLQAEADAVRKEITELRKRQGAEAEKLAMLRAEAEDLAKENEKLNRQLAEANDRVKAAEAAAADAHERYEDAKAATAEINGTGRKRANKG
jgi:hypothetical protein